MLLLTLVSATVGADVVAAYVNAFVYAATDDVFGEIGGVALVGMMK